MHISQSGQNCKPDGEKLEFWATEAPEMRSVGWSEVSARRPEAQNRTPSAALTQRATQTERPDPRQTQSRVEADEEQPMRPVNWDTIKQLKASHFEILLLFC